jgi:hypothetical protein
MIEITYAEAANQLGVSITALRSAATRGLLTRLPRTGQKQPLIREQVMLFKGKSRLSLHVLNAKEKDIWSKCAKSVEPPVNKKNMGATVAGIGLASAGTLALLPVILPTGGTPGSEVPQGNPFLMLVNLLEIIHS